MTSQCPFCGSPIRPGAAFCANCGHTLPTTQSFLAAEIRTGTELRGRYVISKRLGGGGSGDVYLATDKTLFNRPVVVKRLKINDDNPTDRIEAERNFGREAHALTELNNPHFPQILDYFIDGPSQYLVMEFVAGQDLSKVIEQAGGPLPEPEVIYYGLQIADLLIDLQSRDPPIVHRDIKPANIVVNQAKQATLVDFGIARSKARPSGPNAADPRDSAAWGTPGYAPPEQVAGETVPKSDVYALGATLHHLITDRDPRDHVGEPFPPARKLNPKVSQPFSDLLDQMLQDDSRRRPDAATLQQQLQQIAMNARVSMATDTLPPTSSLPTNIPLPQTPVQSRPVAPAPPTAAVRLLLGNVTVDSVPKLVALADRNWEDARRKLYSGELTRWLRSVGADQLAAQAEATTISTPDQDMGLESFLHRADPQLAQPRLELEPQSINAGTLGGNGKKRERWSARNTGRGTLVARVHGQTSWVQVQPSVITLRAGQTITGTVEVSRPQAPGQQISSVVADAGPAGQASIEVHATAPVAQASSGGSSCLLRAILVILLLVAVAVVAVVVISGLPVSNLVATPTTGSARPTSTHSAPATVAISDPLPPAADSWSSAGNDPQRTYFNPTEIGVPSGVAWQIALTNTIDPFTKLIVTPNRLYITGRSTVAIDLASHRTMWTQGGSTIGQATLAGDLLLVPGAHQLVARHAADGTVAWNLAYQGTTAGAPLIVGARVYQAEGNLIHSVGLADGKGDQQFSAAQNAQLTQPAALGDTPVSTDADAVVYHWDKGGSVIWSLVLTDTDGSDLNAASPAGVMSDTIFLVAHAGGQARAVAVAADGRELWVQPLPQSAQAAPALADGVAYYTTDSSVVALAAADGHQLWEADLTDITTARGANVVAEPPSIAGSLSYVSTSNGVVVALHRADGSEAAKPLTVTRASRALTSNPVPASGMLFVVSADQQVYALSTTK